MEITRKAANLTEAYQFLDPERPLEKDDEMDHFYVPRPQEIGVAPLLTQLELALTDDDKTLFTGHRGSGKTTELARIERAMRTTHTVIRFHADALLNIGDVAYTDLLVMLGAQAFEQAKQAGIELGEKRLAAIKQWYTTHIFEKDVRPKPEASVGLDMQFARFSIKLDAPCREMVRAEVTANQSDLLKALNDLFDALKEKTGRRTLVIVDGLDKMLDLNQVRDLFCQGANALLEPNCRVIYTVPLALYHTNDFQQVRASFPRTFALPNIKIKNRDGMDFPDGRDALKEVLEKRLTPGLIAPDAADRLAELCGGRLKELINLAREAALLARLARGERGEVQVAEVEAAARKVRNTYRAALTQEQYRELWRIYSGGPFVNSPVTRELLHNMSLLEYDGGDAWWAVNPIVAPLLEERRHELSALA